MSHAAFVKGLIVSSLCSAFLSEHYGLRSFVQKRDNCRDVALKNRSICLKSVMNPRASSSERSEQVSLLQKFSGEDVVGLDSCYAQRTSGGRMQKSNGRASCWTNDRLLCLGDRAEAIDVGFGDDRFWSLIKLTVSCTLWRSLNNQAVSSLGNMRWHRRHGSEGACSSRSWICDPKRTAVVQEDS
jgi:hypothetical protein